MPPTFEDYCQKLQNEADARAREAEAHSALVHLHAFNFGRSVGRMESARNQSALRLRWLLLGAAAGIAVVALCLQIFLSERILLFAK